MDTEARLRGGRRERVGFGRAKESQSPGRRVAGEVVGGELGERVESEEREQSPDAGEELRDEDDSVRSNRSGSGVGGGGGGIGGLGGGGEAVEVGGALVEDFEVAGVAEP